MGKVEMLVTQKDHKDFFKRIYLRDQSYRGASANIENDLENLILVSHYVNTYGYPSKEIQPNEDIIPYVWIHNWIDDIGIITFPLIKQGLQKNAFDLKRFREYLRGLYRNKHGDNRFDKLSTIQIIQELNIPEKQEINISEILTIYQEYRNLLESFDDTIGIWATKQQVRKIPFGSSYIEDVIESEFIEIRAVGDQYYFKLSSKHWKEDTFRLLIKVDGYRNVYKKNVDDVFYYKICDNKELIYYSIDGTRRKTYYKCSQRL